MLKSKDKNTSGGKDLRILVAHGVNLDLLGQRETSIYGQTTLAEIETGLSKVVSDLARLAGVDEVVLVFFQTNAEPELFAKLSEGWDGVVLNPGAWTHTSLALADRLVGLALPFVEVHLSNLAKREALRQHSFSAPHAAGVVYGFGPDSYRLALYGLLLHLATKKNDIIQA